MIEIVWFIVLFISHLAIFFLGFSLKTRGIEFTMSAAKALTKLDPSHATPGVIKRLSADEMRKRKSGEHEVEKEVEKTFNDLLE